LYGIKTKNKPRTTIPKSFFMIKCYQKALE